MLPILDLRQLSFYELEPRVLIFEFSRMKVIAEAFRRCLRFTFTLARPCAGGVVL